VIAIRVALLRFHGSVTMLEHLKEMVEIDRILAMVDKESAAGHAPVDTSHKGAESLRVRLRPFAGHLLCGSYVSWGHVFSYDVPVLH
jgi:hypothetical protein